MVRVRVRDSCVKTCAAVENLARSLRALFLVAVDQYSTRLLTLLAELCFTMCNNYNTYTLSFIHTWWVALWFWHQCMMLEFCNSLSCCAGDTACAQGPSDVDLTVCIMWSLSNNRFNMSMLICWLILCCRRPTCWIHWGTGRTQNLWLIVKQLSSPLQGGRGLSWAIFQIKAHLLQEMMALR